MSMGKERTPIVIKQTYTDTEHYQITKDFLNRHKRMLELLLAEEEKNLKATSR